MLQAGPMKYPFTVAYAIRLLCLTAFACLTSPNAHGKSDARESQYRLERTNLLVYRDNKGAVRPVKSVRDWAKRRAEILRGMTVVMGPLPGEDKRCPLDPKVEYESDCGDYVQRFLTYASEPGSRVPAYLLIPKAALDGKQKTWGILCLHQTHRLGQKVVVGLGESPNDEYGVELVKRGYVCLAPPYPLLANY